MIHTVLGQPAVFRLIEANELPADLSTRERRLLVGALNFHALMAPARELEFHAYDGGWDSLPRTTDDSTFDGLSRAYRTRLFSLAIQSLVVDESRSSGVSEKPALDLARGSTRHIHISRDDVLDFDPPRDISPDLARRVLRAVRARMPLIYDEARDLELLRHRGSYLRRARRRDYPAEFRAGGAHADGEIVIASPAPADAPKAILFGLHWFELGGAERWAFESVRIARDAGFLPVVLTNRDSHQPWVTRQELDGALIIPFSEPTAKSQTAGVEELLRSILRSFDVRGVVVHHNQWLYDRLHWLALSRPDMPIMDSTHIVEYRGGGFPLSSVLVEEVISRHHVISPSLKRWMTDVQGVDAEKIVMAPLGGLTVEPRSAKFRHRDGEPFTVAFIGRMARQKAPEVFVELAHRLKGSRHPLRFVMHGDGEMSTWVEDIIRTEGLTEVIHRRDSSVPVSLTLDEAHLLVVPSHNEGLTLTTLEAIAHGVPVISTDVGAQSDIIPDRALVPRFVHRAVHALAEKVEWLAGDEGERERLWNDEREAEKNLMSTRTATEWFAQEVGSW